jgi:hypothetical protein
VADPLFSKTRKEPYRWRRAIAMARFEVMSNEISRLRELPNPTPRIPAGHDCGIGNSAKQASNTVIGAGEPAFNITFR